MNRLLKGEAAYYAFLLTSRQEREYCGRKLTLGADDILVIEKESMD